MTLGDMFSGGNESSVTTLRWLFAHLLRNPDIQDKLHAELDRVVGRDPKTAPTIKDRENLPYLEASILETMRMASPVPLAVPHKTTRDTTVQGYSIPKNTTVILNLWAIHHNTDDWQKHDVFDPSRFLGEDGKISSFKTRNLLPFGAGRRVCIGETDAKTVLFLFASRFLHKFKLEHTEALPEMVGHLGVVNFPKPYKLRAIARL
ncbi:steroid 17-alpha-hydroxylase/17,20 lyase [Exaiptasia diaphana]|uniref:Cytochrome P450 n=1 Tax=Exaiptasia diaphana TaxID=2652724 RepID=A0A913WZS1_EXADI|nr:steroid 17-alpha-hydroxylase/17,20 lyase [Exaiptasia diaphana]